MQVRCLTHHLRTERKRCAECCWCCTRTIKNHLCCRRRIEKYPPVCVCNDVLSYVSRRFLNRHRAKCSVCSFNDSFNCISNDSLLLPDCYVAGRGVTKYEMHFPSPFPSWRKGNVLTRRSHPNGGIDFPCTGKRKLLPTSHHTIAQQNAWK